MNADHLAVLEKGVKAWNTWLARDTSISPDLSGADLADRNLSGINLYRANLNDAALQGVNLETATLDEARLQGADLTHSTLSGATFRNADAARARFDFAEAEDANFKNALLKDATLTNGKFVHASFYFANLSNADLSHADLSRAILTGALIEGADLTWTNLEDAQLTGEGPALRKWLTRARNPLLASYGISTLRQMKWPEKHTENRDGDPDKGIPGLNFSRYDLSNLDLSSNDLSGTNLRGAVLHHSSLAGANLEGADLTNAQCDSAIFEGANLSDATVKGASLYRAQMEGVVLTNTNLQGAILIKATGLNIDMLLPARNYMLAIYDVAFAVDKLHLPANHRTIFIKKKLDPRVIGVALETAILQGADFSGWTLSHVSFKGADLSGAVFDQTKAIRSNFSHAVLDRSHGVNADFTGADFRGSSMKGAKFGDATVPQLSNFSRSDLSNAELPLERAVASALATLDQLSKHVWLSIMVLLGFWVTSVLLAVSATDRSLLSAEGLFRVGSLPVVVDGRAFFLAVPVAILISFFVLHCMLQSIWDEASKLPTVLMSGMQAEKSIDPWLISGMARCYLALQGERSPRRSVQQVVSVAALYFSAPGAIAVFWGRYVCCRDWAVTALHLVAVLFAIILSTAFYKLAVRTLNGERVEGAEWGAASIIRAIPRKTWWGIGALGTSFASLTIVTLLSTPAMSLRSSEANARWRPDAWVARLADALGVRPRLIIRDEIISASPAQAGGKGEIAKLDGRNLQYSDARRAQFIGASLIGAKLDYADLKDANLNYADLRAATLLGADLTGATVRGAHFEGADLRMIVGGGELDKRGAIISATTRLPK